MTETIYTILIPGKIIINCGYLVLDNHTCATISPNNLSMVKVLKKFNINPTITIKTNFLDNATLKYDQNFYSIKNIEPSMSYCLKIINTFYHITNDKPNHDINIEFILNDILFSKKESYIQDSIKTGLGSSCIFLIGIVGALLNNKICIKELFELCLKINNILAPKSSGCDIASCIYGNSLYKKYIPVKCDVFNNCILLLGSFNKSTNTRDMIKIKMESKNWDELATINSALISIINLNKINNLKNNYKDYLIKLREISSSIVPLKQYEILIKSFEFDIIGCGISGSGGEDCVWCLIQKDKNLNIIDFWKQSFEYVNVLGDLNGQTKFIYEKY